jgi:hypothetical protein
MLTHGARLCPFGDVVVNTRIVSLPTGDPLKLRLDIVDGSLLDVFISVTGRYSYHWERRLIGKGDLYRHDNAPHNRWRHVATFPMHFHDGNENNVVESSIVFLRPCCTSLLPQMLLASG